MTPKPIREQLEPREPRPEGQQQLQVHKRTREQQQLRDRRRRLPLLLLQKLQDQPQPLLLDQHLPLLWKWPGVAPVSKDRQDKLDHQVVMEKMASRVKKVDREVRAKTQPVRTICCLHRQSAHAIPNQARQARLVRSVLPDLLEMAENKEETEDPAMQGHQDPQAHQELMEMQVELDQLDHPANSALAAKAHPAHLEPPAPKVPQDLPATLVALEKMEEPVHQEALEDQAMEVALEKLVAQVRLANQAPLAVPAVAHTAHQLVWPLDTKRIKLENNDPRPTWRSPSRLSHWKLVLTFAWFYGLM